MLYAALGVVLVGFPTYVAQTLKDRLDRFDRCGAAVGCVSGHESGTVRV